MTDTSRNGLEELTREQCLELLASVPVGRIGASVDFRPFIFPVNFRLYNDKIMIRTVSGTKLDAALSGQIVAFEADGYTHDGTSGWSVLVRGAAEEVTDPAELKNVQAIPIHTFAFDQVPERVVLISTVGISGRGFDHSCA